MLIKYAHGHTRKKGPISQKNREEWATHGSAAVPNNCPTHKTEAGGCHTGTGG